MHKMWSEIIVVLFLIWLSYIDIKKQEIHLLYPLVMGGMGMIYRCIWLHSWTDLIYGSIACLILCLLSWAMQNGLGEGDLFVLEASSFWMSWGEFMFMVFMSFFWSAVAGVALMVFRKKRVSFRIPFIPFLLLGYGLSCLL